MQIVLRCQFARFGLSDGFLINYRTCLVILSCRAVYLFIRIFYKAKLTIDKIINRTRQYLTIFDWSFHYVIAIFFIFRPTLHRYIIIYVCPRRHCHNMAGWKKWKYFDSVLNRIRSIFNIEFWIIDNDKSSVYKARAFSLYLLKNANRSFLYASIKEFRRSINLYVFFFMYEKKTCLTFWIAFFMNVRTFRAFFNRFVIFLRFFPP